MPFELPSRLHYAFELRKTEQLSKLREQLPPANQGRWWSLREYFSRSRTTEAIDVYFSQVTRSHLTLLLQGSHIPDPLAFDFSDYVSVVCRQAAESCGHPSVIRALSSDKAWLVDLCRREMLREVERRRLDWELGGCPTSAIWDEEEQEAIRAEQAARWEAMLASCREAEEEAREAARSGLSIDDQTSNSSSPSPADPPTETPCKTGGTEPPHPERHQHALFVDLYKRIIVKVNKSTFDSYDGVTKTALGDYIAGRIAGRVSEPKARAIEAAICAEAIRLKMHIPQDLRTRFDA